MGEYTERFSDPAKQKETIRRRYQGIDTALLDVIPARDEDSTDAEAAEKRVGIYARVSTDDPRQTSSYELQKNHYQDMVSRHSGWRLTEIYADEGISGTSLAHRDAFVRMIDDCRAGKLDLIVTKSVSRFARNVVDCIRYVRELKALKPPVGVLFETENIFTLNPDSEMSLAFLSTLAQEESHNKSEIMNASIEMRFRRGIFLTPPLLGYDRDPDGNLIVNEEEAKTVRLIFSLYLYGCSCRQIASLLERLGRTTRKGNGFWSDNSVLHILKNERHCGDVLARKTWTPSYLDHKARKNRFDRNQYLQRNHHTAIISRGDFIAAQQRMTNSSSGGTRFLPHPLVVPDGILAGYVLINPGWAGFTADDYIKASTGTVPAADAAGNESDGGTDDEAGMFDLRGYETVHARCLAVADKPCIVFHDGELRFNAAAVRSFPDSALYVELLIHPGRLLFAVRPYTGRLRYAVRWAAAKRQKNRPPERLISRPVGGKAFLPALYTLCGWQTGRHYRIIGTLCQKNREAFLLFDLKDAQTKEHDETAWRNTGDAAGCFGTDYYKHKSERSLPERSGWNSRRPAVGSDRPQSGASSRGELRRQILSLLREMRQKDDADVPSSPAGARS